ncbi:unnamed protein product, partial [Amoebophrya sp. A120]|eukprot:GSA120T00016215001.1
MIIDSVGEDDNSTGRGVPMQQREAFQNNPSDAGADNEEEELSERTKEHKRKRKARKEERRRRREARELLGGTSGTPPVLEDIMNNYDENQHADRFDSVEQMGITAASGGARANGMKTILTGTGAAAASSSSSTGKRN